MKEYLMEHPTSMPLREAAMNYLWELAPPVLKLVPPPEQAVPEEGADELQSACASGA
jgi:hypothetical protein